MTFSIVAADPARGEVGVAVASKVLAVGVDTVFAEAGVGAVVTQGLANTTYGEKGLRLLRRGVGPEEVIQRLTRADPGARERQAAVVSAGGGPATYTGRECDEWAGGIAGGKFACQGNCLTGEAVVEEMARAFTRARGALAGRLMTALAAGERAGGDRRGRQSASLVVVKASGGYLGLSDRYVDLRVDDHPAPVAELWRLLDVWCGQRDLPAFARR